MNAAARPFTVVAAFIPAQPAQPSNPPLPPPATPARSAHPHRTSWALALATIAVLLLLHHHSVAAMLGVWSRSQTFAHGFAVAPISAWLVWRRRRRLAAIAPRPAPAGIALLLALGAAWLLAFVAAVPVVAQYAVVLMVAASVIAILGWDYARALAFPLAYLLLAVPFGEVFIAPLIEFTARFTVGALQLSGVPVFRENNYFSIPSGNWSVVDACSGLRYVIASLALGTLYAYLHYRSPWRRLLFVAVALLLPVLANGLRAYAIVMIGHLTDMRLAVGVDHLVYGWVFFGLVTGLLFWSASFWREPSRPPTVMTAAPARGRRRDGGARPALAALACIGAAAAWTLLAAPVLARPVPAGPGTALTIAAAPGWLPEPMIETAISSAPLSSPLSTAAAAAPPATAPSGPDAWAPAWTGTALRHASTYRTYGGAGASVTLHVAVYASQPAGAGLLAAAPSTAAHWRATGSRTRQITAAGRALRVRESVLQRVDAGPSQSPGQAPDRPGTLLVWRWYRQSGVDTNSAAVVKLLLARSRLLRHAEDGAEIVVSTPFDEHSGVPGAVPIQVLQDFLDAMLPAIDKGINHATRR